MYANSELVMNFAFYSLLIHLRQAKEYMVKS